MSEYVQQRLAEVRAERRSLRHRLMRFEKYPYVQPRFYGPEIPEVSDQWTLSTGTCVLTVPLRMTPEDFEHFEAVALLILRKIRRRNASKQEPPPC